MPKCKTLQYIALLFPSMFSILYWNELIKCLQFIQRFDLAILQVISKGISKLMQSTFCVLSIYKKKDFQRNLKRNEQNEQRSFKGDPPFFVHNPWLGVIRKSTQASLLRPWLDFENILASVPLLGNLKYQILSLKLLCLWLDFENILEYVVLHLEKILEFSVQKVESNIFHHHHIVY